MPGDNKRALATTEERGGELTVPRLSEAYLETVRHNMEMFQGHVMQLLEQGVDFGIPPKSGLRKPMLYDTGVNTVCAGFQAYPKPTVIFHEITEHVITFIVRMDIVHYETERVIGSGIGAASTFEPKRNSRWVVDPREFGYTEAQMAELRHRERDGKTEYRIQEPDLGDKIENTIQMAAIRAGRDAVKSLPGVGSALKKTFGDTDNNEAPNQQSEHNWKAFWAKTREMGLEPSRVRDLLGVKRLEDWLGKDKTLDQALEVLAQKLAGSPGRQDSQRAHSPPPGVDPGTGEILDDTVKIPDSKPAPDPEPGSITTPSQLFAAAYARWKMQPKDVLAALNLGTQSDVRNPWECYLRLKVVKGEAS